MRTLTKGDIPRYTDGPKNWTDYIKAGRYRVRVRIEPDDCMREPWKEHDGHGPVSEWRAKDSKAPGERILCEDRGQALFYDFAGAVAIARRDGWDTPPYKTGTAGERAARAAEADFDRLRQYCAGDWQYVSVGMELSLGGEVLAMDWLGGVESDNDYWRECAADMANDALHAHLKETRERRFWEARDVQTIGA